MSSPHARDRRRVRARAHGWVNGLAAPDEPATADPDFLNGWRHSLAIVRALHDCHPELAFDCTTKVEHLLEHADVWEEMAAAGCLFVVCALESVNDEIVIRLDKGHATPRRYPPSSCCASTGSRPGPRLCPSPHGRLRVTCWIIVDFVAAHDLVANVDPVQYTIRLLVAEGSLLLKRNDLPEHLGPYQAGRLSYPRRSADPAADRLQGRLSALVQQSAAAQEQTGLTFARIRAAALEATGEPYPSEAEAIPMGSTGDQGLPNPGSAQRSPPRASLVLSQGEFTTSSESLRGTQRGR